METTSLQAGPPPAAAPATKPASREKHPLRLVLEMLADLRITVALFAMSLVLVFWGTLAQVDTGVWTVVHNYFRCYLVWVPLKVVMFNSIGDAKIDIPFPGGWLIGGAMLVNLLAAHAIRFKLTLSRAGILLIHAGIIVMMVGEFVTGLYQQEGQMIIYMGKSSNSVVDSRSSELAVVHTHDDDIKKDDVTTVPSTMLKDGEVIKSDKLPFQIEVITFMANSRLRDTKNKLADKGFGRVHLAEDVAAVSGVDPNQKVDMPATYVKLTSLAGKNLGTWLFSTHFEDPQWLEVDGKKYQLALRFKKTTRNYKIRLNRFTHAVFPGTKTPKDFHSYITLTDPDLHVDRETEIYMNHPLYFQGETFYQSEWIPDMDGNARGTVLQVVRNPGWVLPYLSCGIVGLGMLMHFGLTLYRFIDRRIVR